MAKQTVNIDAFDLLNLPADFYADPYPYYHALREKQPVYTCPDGSFILTRHADLFKVYRNASLFSSDKKKQFKPLLGDGLLYEHHTTSLVFNDPPLHTHVRKAIGDALSMKTVVAMEPGLRLLVNTLLDNIANKKNFDLLSDYAGIIPVEVIGHLLRIPREERHVLQRWAAAILGALEFNLTKEKLDFGNQCVAEFIDYLDVLIADKRHHLSDANDDLLSRLIKWEADGFVLSTQQLYHQCIFILNAGHETTTNLIANGIHALCNHPAQLALLKQQAALIDSAIEELLRYEAPVQLGNRTALADCDIGGKHIAAGNNLTLAIGAANRDPAIYPDPDTLDISRHPKNHFSFAGGIHTCAGLNVARLEAKIAIPELLRRFPGVHTNGEPRRDKRARFRAILSLPMAI